MFVINRNQSSKNEVYYILIFLLTPFLFIKLFDLYYYALPKLLFLLFIFALMIKDWFLFEKHKFINVKKYKFLHLFLVVYAVLLMLSVFFSYNLKLSVMGRLYREEGIFTLLLYLFLFYFSFRYLALNEKIMKLIVFVATIVSIHGVLQYFGFDFLIAQGTVIRPFSTFRNPNFLGSYLVLVLPLAIYLHIINKKKIHFFGFSVFIIYFVLLATYTRGSWVGAFISFLCFIFFCRKSKMEFRNLYKVIFVFGLATLIFISVDNSDFLARVTSIGTDAVSFLKRDNNYDYAGSFRIFIWERVIQLIAQRPWIGYGPEALGDVFTNTYRQEVISRFGYIIFDKAHNEYLHIAVTSGIPALLTYLLLVVTILKESVKKIYQNPIMIPIFSSVIGYLVQAFFNISIVSSAHLYWIFLGALMYLSNEKQITYEK